MNGPAPPHEIRPFFSRATTSNLPCGRLPVSTVATSLVQTQRRLLLRRRLHQQPAHTPLAGTSFKCHEQPSTQAAPLDVGMHAHPHYLGTAVRVSLERAHRDHAFSDHADEELATSRQVFGLDVVQVPVPRPTPRMGVDLAQRQVVKPPHGTTVPASIAPDLHVMRRHRFQAPDRSLREGEVIRWRPTPRIAAPPAGPRAAGARHGAVPGSGLPTATPV